MFRFVVLFVLVLASLPSPGEMQGNGDLRLAGKHLDRVTEGYGRLEVFLNGVWGTVCGPIIDRDVANTACRQLGYQFFDIYGSVQDLQVTEANASTPILLDIENCINYDQSNHILRCTYSTSDSDLSYCSHDYDAAIQCDGKETIFYDTEVRLSNGTWPSTGVLEVYVQDKRQWGTFCSSNFNQAAADSACRQLGYTSALGFTGVDRLQESTVWVSSAKCSSSQPCLNSCFNYPTSPVSQCSGDGKVVFLNCTFDINIADSSTPGSELLCTYVPRPPSFTHYWWIGVGIGAVLVVLFLIVFVAVGTVVLFKLKSKHTHYVQVNS